VVGGKAAGQKAQEAYVDARYHQPADEWSESLDFGGQAKEIDVLYDLGRQIANSTYWPDWKAGSEFKAARDRTAAQRR
jgi:hypothetical protein